MSTDLNAMLTTATQMFNTMWPVFALVMLIGFGSAAIKFARDFVEEIHALQNGRPNPIEKLKNQPPPDDPTSDPPMKRKNDFGRVVGIGDDGELVYEGDQIVEDEEPRYMRRIM